MTEPLCVPQHSEVVDGLAIAILGDTLLAVWNAPAQLPRLQKLDLALTQLTAQHPQGILLLLVVLPSSLPPDTEARRFASQSIKTHVAHLRRMVTVALGDGVWNNIVRAILRGTISLTGRSNLHSVTATELDGLRELSNDATEHTPSLDELTQALRACYQQLGLPLF